MKISIITETIEDLEFDEPFGHFEFEGDEFPHWGNLAGNNKTKEYDVGKFNRYAKIGNMADELIAKFKEMVESGHRSTSGRSAYASIIMMKNGIRIGNEDSAAGYESGLEDNEGDVVQTFGTTTLLNKHVTVTDGSIQLDFLGKTQVKQNITIKDPFIVKYAKLYHDPDLPDDKWIGIDYNDLFKFVKSDVGDGFIPKDFRTFCANITAWRRIKNYLDKPERETKTEVNDEIKEIVEVVSNKLGNTEAIAKRNYIDARMLDWFKGKRLS